MNLEDAVINSAISGALALLVAMLSIYLTHHFIVRRLFLKGIFERWVKAHEETYGTMVNCFYTLNQFGNVPPQSLNEYNQYVRAAMDKWEHAERLNAIWLNSIQKSLTRARGAFRQVSFAIFLALPPAQTGVNPASYSSLMRQIDWKEFSEAFADCSKAIRENLNISYLEKELKKVFN